MTRFACSLLMLACLPLAAAAQGTDASAGALAADTSTQEGALDQVPVETPKEPVVISDYQPSDQGPQIVIRPGDKKVFYEYRVNGQLMEIKVVPDVGPAYYLVPADGGGWIQEGKSDLLVPSWVLFRW